MMRRRIAAGMKAAALALLLLAGCAMLRPEADEALLVSDIVAATLAAARATPDEQRRQLGHAQQMFGALQNDASRVRLAALLSTLPPPLRDDARAAALLEPLAARRPETPLVQFAALAGAGAAERARAGRELRAAERREGEAEERAKALRQQLEQADERASTLRQQVEALKSIERGILEREERRRTTKR
jgi:hypothetical protein